MVGKEEMKRQLLLSALTIICAFTAPLHAQSPEEIDEIDAVVLRAIETFAPVGLSVSVVRGGDLVYAQGFGVKHMERGGEITADTLFQMASTTKAITAAALGILVDEGLIEWDGRVIDYIPEFRLADPWVTREFTVRDLLTHRSGLPLGAADLLHWPDGNGTLEDILAALPHIEPASSFRSEWAYDNVLYVVAGEIIPRVTGLSWEDFVQARIFDAIGAGDCVSMPGRLTPRSDFAEPHARMGTGGAAVPALRDRAVADPAGSGVCSANGIALWTQTLLNGGVAPNGMRILSEETVAELMAPVVPMRISYTDRNVRGSNLKAYALGWIVQDYHGTLLASHTGAAAGGVTYVGLLPRENTAVVILANDQTPAMAAIADSLMLLFTQEAGERPDYIATIAERVEQMHAQGAFAEADIAPGPQGPASLPISAYAGIYEDTWYGTVEIEEREGGLYMIMSRSPSMHGPLEHVRFNTFVARWATPGLGADAYVTFNLGHDGAIESIAMDTVNPNADFSYNFHDLDLRPIE